MGRKLNEWLLWESEEIMALRLVVIMKNAVRCCRNIWQVSSRLSGRQFYEVSSSTVSELPLNFLVNFASNTFPTSLALPCQLHDEFPCFHR
jgi:hypothetical protein